MKITAALDGFKLNPELVRRTCRVVNDDSRVDSVIIHYKHYLNYAPLVPKKKIFIKNDLGLLQPICGTQRFRGVANLTHHLGYGTKQRNLILNDDADVDDIVLQQFKVAENSRAGIVMIEPEVSIEADNRDYIEDQLLKEIHKQLDITHLQKVWLKLTPPATPNKYKTLVAHPKVERLVFLSGGLSRADAVQELLKNDGVSASFSRALLEGLSEKDGMVDFVTKLNRSIVEIYSGVTG